jgi:uncharacterized protein YkvS
MMEKSRMLSVTKKAKTGDTVLFQRKDLTLEGIVYLVRDNSVLVKISKEDANILGYETQNTVVGHGNYMIMKCNLT